MTDEKNGTNTKQQQIKGISNQTLKIKPPTKGCKKRILLK